MVPSVDHVVEQPADLALRRHMDQVGIERSRLAVVGEGLAEFFDIGAV